MISVFFAAILLFAPAPPLREDNGDFEAPRWSRPPDGDLVSALYPGFARNLGVSGWAEVQCFLEEDGHPFNCRVNDEEPKGLGFGAAARLVVASGQLRTGRLNGAPVPGTARSVVRFRVEDMEDEVSSWNGPEPTPRTLQLAREIVEQRVSEWQEEYAEDTFDGLDYDRRLIVQQWMNELLPGLEERRVARVITQMARLFDDVQLKAMLSGDTEHVTFEAITPDHFNSAYPTPSPDEEAAFEEVKARYCQRFSCVASEGPPARP